MHNNAQTCKMINDDRVAYKYAEPCWAFVDGMLGCVCRERGCKYGLVGGQKTLAQMRSTRRMLFSDGFSTFRERNVNFNRMTTMAGLAVLMTAPVYATPYCVAVDGGYGKGGTSFVARNFVQPGANSCSVWTGYTKTAGTVVLITSGTACLSSNSEVLTISVTSADPSYFGAGKIVSDYIQLCPEGASKCPIGQGSDVGAFSGTAAAETCTSALQELPATHD